MHRILILTFSVIILLLTITSVILLGDTQKKMSGLKNTPSPKTSSIPTSFTPFTAKFKIYTDGTKRDFSADKYHNLSEDVFISATDPELIHVNKENITWQDFFNSLPSPMMLTTTCLTTGTGQNFCSNSQKKLNFYLNGENRTSILLEEIEPSDELNIIYGDNDQVSNVLGASTSASPRVGR